MSYQNVYGRKNPAPNRKLQEIAEVLLQTEVYKTSEYETGRLQNLAKECNLALEADELRQITRLLVQAHIIPSSFLKFKGKESILPMYLRDLNREKLARILRERIDYGGLFVLA